MKNLKSTYITGSNGQAINGRTRIYSIFYASTVVGASTPLIEFKDGGSSGDTLLYANDALNSYSGTATNVYDNPVPLDLPSEGVLFPSGVYVASPAWWSTDPTSGTIGVCIFFEGGSAA